VGCGRGLVVGGVGCSWKIKESWCNIGITWNLNFKKKYQAMT
jgi:hypothetical protein